MSFASQHLALSPEVGKLPRRRGNTKFPCLAYFLKSDEIPTALLGLHSTHSSLQLCCEMCLVTDRKPRIQTLAHLPYCILFPFEVIGLQNWVCSPSAHVLEPLAQHSSAFTCLQQRPCRDTALLIVMRAAHLPKDAKQLNASHFKAVAKRSCHCLIIRSLNRIMKRS